MSRFSPALAGLNQGCLDEFGDPAVVTLIDSTVLNFVGVVTTQTELRELQPATNESGAGLRMNLPDVVLELKDGDAAQITANAVFTLAGLEYVEANPSTDGGLMTEFELVRKQANYPSHGGWK